MLDMENDTESVLQGPVLDMDIHPHHPNHVLVACMDGSAAILDIIEPGMKHLH
jgi:hypothetical protein